MVIGMPFKRAGLALALIVCAVVMAIPASAQQPSRVNPTESSVQEKQLLEALKPVTGGTAAVAGRVSIPDKRSGNLIQPQALDWRTFHQTTLPRIGAGAILGIIVLTTLFYMMRGKVRIPGGRSGATMVRFGFLDRFAHWLTATSFIALALTGLNLTFGKYVVLPIVGDSTFTMLSQAGKYVHNYISFSFALGLLLMLFLWVGSNIPHPRDILWFLKGGGLIGGMHPAAGRFNGGQKVIFWSVILGGGAIAVSGYVLMFPFAVTDVGGQQLANIVHALGGVVLTAIIIAHIYIGSVGMEGAFEAMGSGKVDLNWAKEHHSVWVDRVVAKDPGAIHGKPQAAE